MKLTGDSQPFFFFNRLSETVDLKVHFIESFGC